MSPAPGTPLSQIKGPQNNALERTRRVGVPASRAVVGVPPCRSTQCWTDRGTDRRAFVPPPSAVADAPSVLPLGNRPSMSGVGQVLRQSRPALGARPNIFQHPVGSVSTRSFPSTSSRLGVNGQTTNSGFPVVTSRQEAARPSNKGLKWTRSASLPLSGPRHLTQCWTGPRW